MYPGRIKPTPEGMRNHIMIVMVVLLAYSTAYAITQTESIPRGQIVDRIVALSDSSQSYALYLPSNYTPNRKWPVLYAFDPGARGRVPVERFKEAAEKYGWIVLGSNNSRNGPWDVSVNAWNAMQTDTHQRFAIDDERLYATGFSGGARAAVRIAIACKCLAGVIASGNYAGQAFAGYRNTDCRARATGKTGRIHALIVDRKTLMSICLHRVPGITG